MAVSVKGFVSSLLGAKDVNPQFGQIASWAESGEVERLTAIAEAMEKTCTPLPPWVRCSIFEYTERALALTPSPACAEALLSMALIPRRKAVRAGSPPPPEQHQPYLASLLASGQERDTLIALIEQHGSDDRLRELLSCLLHEAVLRGLRAEQEPVLKRFAAALRAANHPLARLPLALLELEQDLCTYLPTEGLDGWSGALPFGPGRATARVPADAGAAFDTRETTTEAQATMIKRAVAQWEQASNGMSEARAFAVQVSITHEGQVHGLLSSLPLDCLQGVEERELGVASLRPDQVVGTLFAAAANGGAYLSQRWGAYGRLAAWDSVAGLVGAPESDDPATVERAARECGWWWFEATTDWFEQVAWDLGIVAVRPDGRTVALLAATDTD